MRKFLAALLVVLTLVASVVPAVATEAQVPTGKDGSVATDAASLGLIVTEYIANTSSTGVENIWWDDTGKQTPNTTGDDTNPATYDAFTFVEFYNAGTEYVDMYKYNIASGEVDESTTADNSWRKNQKLTNSVKLQGGSIYDGIKMPGKAADYGTKYPCVNDNTARVYPGEFVIVWFWTNRTLEVAAQALKENRAFAGAGENHKGFRDHYAQVTGKEVPADTQIIAVYAGSVYAGGTDKLADPAEGTRVTLTTGTGMMYALLDSRVAFDVKADPVYTAADGKNEAVKLLWTWGTGVGQGMRADENYSTIYVPANTTPYLKNRTNGFEGVTTKADDYLGVNFVDSYFQAAMFDTGVTPTPGTMDAVQWALVDPDRVPETLVPAANRTEGWVDALANAYAVNRLPEPKADDGDSDEEQREITLLTREEIEKMLNEEMNKRAPGEKKYVLLWWGKLLIGVGIAVGVAGIAVLVILIIKKKKAAPVEDVAEDVAEDAADDDVVVDATIETTEE